MKEFIVISSDGQTFDNEGFEVENDQVLDYIEADNIKKAQLIAIDNIKEGSYGAFKDFLIFEKRDTKDRNQGLYIFLSPPASVDFVDNIIDDTVVELFYDKRAVLIRGILSIERELLSIEESKADISTNYSSTLKGFINLQENENLEKKLCELSDKELLNLWREMESVQFEEYVNYHTRIKDCKNATWL